MATVQDFRNKVTPNWCPGCGDFAVQSAIQRALAEIGAEPQNVAVVSGIGCSGRISGYINSYGFHAIHGRSLPVAQGIKLANRNLTVLASGGDGDGFGIGLNHFMHAVRRNMNITYIVMDNAIYGLTKGQTSPTSAHGFINEKKSPLPNIEHQLIPSAVALGAGITFLAQSQSSNIKQLTRVIKEAIQHKGFSLVNVFSPCVTFNKVNTYEWYKENCLDLDTVEGYDASDRSKAMAKVQENQGMLTGLIFKDDTAPPYEELIQGYKEEAITGQDLTLSRELFDQCLAEFA
ncbi:MAG: 2-oxoacid ferredoxin oxidoreductase [Bacilli bacterium]|nr:2-oxoacid ferredoxin oxidoreductase [Bacilli bacterium]